MAQPFIYLASSCYGGLAHARFMRSVLALRAACARKNIALQLDLGGGEALISRARAAMLAKFLATEATHLLFVDGDQAFDAEEVLRLLRASDQVIALGDAWLLIFRSAAEEIVASQHQRWAALGDVRGASSTDTAMVFDQFIDLNTRRYFYDLQILTPS